MCKEDVSWVGKFPGRNYSGLTPRVAKRPRLSCAGEVDRGGQLR
jgi:hypothetical protein